VGATGIKLDRKANAEAQILAVVRQLLSELGGDRGLEELAARGTVAHLDRELGLGSLERVELMLRLGDACGVRLPDKVVAEADSVQDLIDAIVREESRAEVHNTAHATVHPTSQGGTAPAVAAPTPARAPDSPALRSDLEESIRRAETLTEILRLRGLGEPGRAHIHLYEENDQLRTITFGELYERASAVAYELLNRGFAPGQTAAIMLRTCAEFFWSFAGVLLAGGIPVPIYPPFRADRIAEYATRQANILRNAEAQFLITWRQAEGLARLLQPRVPSLREVLNAQKIAATPATPEPSSAKWTPVRNFSHRARGEDIAFLQYTSGSTGDPKGVTLTHANLLANIHAIANGLELLPDDVAVTWLPLYHDMGLIGLWLVPLFAAVPVVVMSPLAFLSRPERWLRAIHRHSGTISPAPNFAYELCVRKIPDKDLRGLDLSTWRAAFNGAEPVHADTIERFSTRFAPYGFRRESLLPVYGLAEASLAVSVPKIGSGARVDRIARSAFESEGRAIPAAADDPAPLEFVGAGKPLCNVEVRIVASDGSDAGDRAEGRLWFRSPSATSGYYRNPAATAPLIREGGWLDSGDLAYLADGDIFITGRAKDVIIKAGRNLYPHEVEDIAGRVQGVRTGCVVAFGAPDARSGTERLVVAAEVRNMADAKRITAEISRAVDAEMGLPPDIVELLPPQSIPKTSSGKLRRSETRRLYLEGNLGKRQQPAWMQIAQLAVRSAGPRAWTLARRSAKNVLETLFGIYVLAVFCVVFVPIWLAASFTRNAQRVAWLGHVGARLVLSATCIPVSIEGRELLAELSKCGPCVFAPNHSSYADTLLMVALLPPIVRFVAKGEVLDMPLLGKLARRSGQFAFDRSDPQARVRQAEEVDAALRRGVSIVIYPEGTFTRVTGVRPFQLGAFKAAVDTQLPVCPVSIRGMRHILQEETFLPRPGRLAVKFGPLLAPRTTAGDDWREIVRLRDQTRETIAREVGEPLL
jgi:fatty-acyl-CoA synthase